MVMNHTIHHLFAPFSADIWNFINKQSNCEKLHEKIHDGNLENTSHERINLSKKNRNLQSCKKVLGLGNTWS